MAIEVKLSADCKTLTITGGSSGSPVELWLNEVQYPMVDPALSTTNGTSTEVDLEYLGGINTAIPAVNNNFPSGELTITWDNIPGISTEQLNGIIKVIITEPGPLNTVVTLTFGAVGLCALNCCLAKKVKELLECKCKECKECVGMLAEVTNVYLLMQGMQVNIAGCVQTTALYIKTSEQYAKAVSLCGVENCNCNC